MEKAKLEELKNRVELGLKNNPNSSALREVKELIVMVEELSHKPWPGTNPWVQQTRDLLDACKDLYMAELQDRQRVRYPHDVRLPQWNKMYAAMNTLMKLIE